MINLTVNGVSHSLDIDPSMPLLYALRNHLQLNGAKYGCGLGQCGACTVIMGDEPVFSCLVPVAVVGSRKVRTIEGLGTPDKPSALQKAFIDKQSAQCGYCIAGMVMRAQALLDRNASPTEAEIRAHMEPNLCRCGTHMRIIASIVEAAGAGKAQASAQTPSSVAIAGREHGQSNPVLTGEQS
jgi:nicotinate dehydrogenase subunit A